MQQKKVMFLVHSLKGGGAERMVSRLANGFAAREYQVSVGLFDTSEIAYEISDNVEIIDFGVKASNRVIKGMKYIGKIHDYLKENQIDVLFAFTISMVPFAVLSKANKVKVIGAERTNPKVLGKMHKVCIKTFSMFCDGYIFQTKGAKKYYPSKVQKKGIIIGNIAPKIEKYENQKIENTICSIGRLNSDKDFATLLKAFELVLKALPTASLHIYGQGEQKQELIALTKKLSIEDYVYWEGFKKNVLSEIQKYSVFAFSSKAEGMPNALVEAMAAGMPCVSSDCDFGPSDLIIDGENGFLVPVEDAEKMAQRIIKLLEDTYLREKIGSNAKKAMRNYSEDKILKSYIEYAEKIIKN